MADDPYAQFFTGSQGTGGTAPAETPVTPPHPPLTAMQRIIVQNVFDTQPARRAQYLRDLGFEMNPDDHNEYRPIGSGGGYAQVDPGILDEFGKGSWAKQAVGAANNLLSKGTDLLGGALSGEALGIGSTAGGILGAPGGLPGIAAGAFLGGILGNVTAEAFKKTAGDLILSKDVPQDAKLTAIQSIAASAIPLALKHGTNMTANAVDHFLESRKTALIQAAKASGGTLPPQLIQRAVKNPEQFTPEAVKGATDALDTTYKGIFGISADDPVNIKSTRQLSPKSIWGRAVAPLNSQADAEVLRLSQNPQADWKVEEITKPLATMADGLASKFDRTVEEDAALGYLKGKVSTIRSKAAGRTEIPYSAGREVLKAIQSDAFDREVPGSAYLKQVIGSAVDENGNALGLRALADQKAAAAGSILPAINAERSKILGNFNVVRQALTPKKLTTAFLGADDITKIQTQKAAALMDATLGTDLSSQLEDKAGKAYMERIYQKSNPLGTPSKAATEMGGALEGALKGGARGAATGAGALGAVGALTHDPVGLGSVGAAVGGTVGAIKGAMTGARDALASSSVDRALSQLAETQASQDALRAAPLLPEGAVRGLQGISPTVVNSAIKGSIPATPAKQEDEDPYSQFFKQSQ